MLEVILFKNIVSLSINLSLGFQPVELLTLIDQTFPARLWIEQ